MTCNYKTGHFSFAVSRYTHSYEVREVTVWIEYVLAENFILDGTILYLTQKTLRLPVKKFRLLFSAAAGGAFALAFPLLGLQGWSSFAAKGAFGVILALVATDSKKVKTNILAVALFYLYTFCYGGLLVGLYSFFNLEYEKSVYLLPQTPAGVALLFLPALIFLAVYVSGALYGRYKKSKLIYRCKITLDGQAVETTGLYDTGNGLTYEGEPVCLIEGKIAKELTRGRERNSEREYKNVYVHTATGAGIFRVFQAKLEIYSEGGENIIDKVYFAVSPEPLGKGYGLILQPQICKEERYD